MNKITPQSDWKCFNKSPYSANYMVYEHVTEDGYVQLITAKVNIDDCDDNWIGDYYCGYVGIPKTHSLNLKHYSNINVDCNGGLTFSGLRKGIVDDKYKDMWFFGFDCAHAWNVECPCSLDYVKCDCNILLNTLKDYASTDPSQYISDEDYLNKLVTKK